MSACSEWSLTRLGMPSFTENNKTRIHLQMKIASFNLLVFKTYATLNPECLSCSFLCSESEWWPQLASFSKHDFQWIKTSILVCWSQSSQVVSESLEYSVQAFWSSIATDPIHFHFMEKLHDLAKSAFLIKIANVI